MGDFKAHLKKTGAELGLLAFDGKRNVLDLLAAGVSETEILADYPDLEAEDIRASLAYAAEEADHPVLVAAAK